MKKLRIIVNVLMLIFLVLSFLRWDGDATFHVVVGSAFTLLAAIHVYINRKWLVSITKAFKTKKLKMTIKMQYFIDISLIITWIIIIISGFIALYFYAGELRMSDTRTFSRIHAILSRISCGLIVIHIIQHLRQIGSYFKIKKRTKQKSTNGG